MMNNWIYDKNPVDAVLFEEPLKALKDDLAVSSFVFCYEFQLDLFNLKSFQRPASPCFKS